MRLVGFNEEQIKHLEKGQLAHIVAEENAIKPEYARKGPVKMVSDEYTIVMLAYTLDGKDNLIAKIYEVNNTYNHDVDIQVVLYDRQMRKMGSMYFPKSRTVKGIANELATMALKKPVLVAEGTDFFETVMAKLYTDNKNDVGKIQIYTYFQKLLDDYLAYNRPHTM